MYHQCHDIFLKRRVKSFRNRPLQCMSNVQWIPPPSFSYVRNLRLRGSILALKNIVTFMTYET